MAKYTPGPWYSGLASTEGGLKVYATNDDLEIICHVPRDRVLINNRVQDNKANAQLIACAPEMMEMLKSIVEDLERYDGAIISIKDIKELIKKATECKQ